MNARKLSGKEVARTLAFEIWAGSKSERRARSILDNEQQMGVYARGGSDPLPSQARGPLPLLKMSPQQRDLELDAAISLTLKGQLRASLCPPHRGRLSHLQI